MRLFIAMDLDSEKDYFNGISEKLDRSCFKGSFPKSFHLTLKFLGEVDEEKVGEIKDRLSAVKFEPFSVEFSNIGFFPNEKYIRVIWVGLSDGQKMIELQRKIDSALLGLFSAEKKFHPHITLARVKFVKLKEKLLKNVSGMKVEKKSVDVKSFRLIKSTLTPEGPIYESLLEVAL